MNLDMNVNELIEVLHRDTINNKIKWKHYKGKDEYLQDFDGYKYKGLHIIRCNDKSFKILFKTFGFIDTYSKRIYVHDINSPYTNIILILSYADKRIRDEKTSIDNNHMAKIFRKLRLI